MILQILYIVLCLLIIYEVLLRNIDCISIAAISYMLYTSNCIIGKVWIPQSGINAYYANISIQTYTLIYFQLLIIYIFLFKLRYKAVSGVKIKSFHYESSYINSVKDNKLYWIILVFLSYIIIFYYLIFKVGLSVFFSYASKGSILSETSMLFGLSIWGGLVCLLHYYLERNICGTILSSGIIILSVLLGSRAYIATAFVGVLLIKSFGWDNKKVVNKNKTKRRIILLGIIMLLFLIIYKLIYKEIRAGDFVGALKVISDSKTWIGLFDIDELRIVCADYNYTVDNHIRIPMLDVIARILSIVPFANDYIPLSFPLRYSDFLQTSIHTTYGLASNIWGEAYAMGGSVFLLLFTLIWLNGLNAVNNRIKTSKSPFLLTVVSYLCFYIHRLDWSQVMGCIKLVLVLYLLKFSFDYFKTNTISLEYSISHGETSYDD